MLVGTFFLIFYCIKKINAKNRHLDMVKKAEAVEFFIGALLEVWLCQNDYEAAKGRGPGATDRDLMAFWVGFFLCF